MLTFNSCHASFASHLMKTQVQIEPLTGGTAFLDPLAELLEKKHKLQQPTRTETRFRAVGVKRRQLKTACPWCGGFHVMKTVVSATIVELS